MPDISPWKKLGVLSIWPESLKEPNLMIPANAAPLAIALLGLVLGMRHATDPDHVIAVTTILSREHRLAAATRIGVIWGLGHTITVLIVGAAIIVFKIAIPARLGLAMEFAVAIVLILLGLGAAASLVRNGASRMRGASPQPDELLVHAHAHTHDGATHVHPHVHVGDHEDTHEDIDDATHLDHRIPAEVLPSFGARRPLLRSFAVGLVHGLAGSAAIALLVLSAIADPLWATVYLAIFCVGTVIGMGLITTAIATPFMVVSRQASWIRQGLVTGSGLLSFGFGLFLAYQIGIVDHLFSSAPIWIPQ
jgi:ABC-type nickel/cobalt efflux system permease component RcnA